MTPADMAELGSFPARAALTGVPEDVADDLATWRSQFDQIYFTTDDPTVSPHAA